ncbi:hypothetical protein AKJ16_DCAP07769 [Drosera capensis]
MNFRKKKSTKQIKRKPIFNPLNADATGIRSTNSKPNKQRNAHLAAPPLSSLSSPTVVVAVSAARWSSDHLFPIKSESKNGEAKCDGVGGGDPVFRRAHDRHARDSSGGVISRFRRSTRIPRNSKLSKRNLQLSISRCRSRGVDSLLPLQGELWGWTCFFIGVMAVAFGSGYYHLKPNDARLVWDRLPMTIAFTSLVAIFIIERVDARKGTLSIIPLLLVGVISIMYWRFFDDLRPYALVQFVPCIALPLMTILLPPMYTHSTYWLWAAVFYLLAKIEEAEDKPIYKLTHEIVSGHTLKHLFAAMVPVFLILMLAKRSIETNRISLAKHWKISWVKLRADGFKAETVTYSSVPDEESQ